MKPAISPSVLLLITSSVLLMLPSCSMNKAWMEKNQALAQAQPMVEQKPAPILYEWTDETTTGRTSIRINLSEQKAYIYRGGVQVAWTMLATGVPKHPTPRGTFSILEKLPHKVSNTYGIIVDSDGDVVNWDAKAGVSRVPNGCRFVGAPMPHWMRITDSGVGMHEGEIPDPGQPASHGCIRLPGELATKLYQIVQIGTPVTVSGTPPSE
jgi:lipoprotein-anchoring transpeptidase ErfK/SrfK